MRVRHSSRRTRPRRLSAQLSVPSVCQEIGERKDNDWLPFDAVYRVESNREALAKDLVQEKEKVREILLQRNHLLRIVWKEDGSVTSSEFTAAQIEQLGWSDLVYSPFLGPDTTLSSISSLSISTPPPPTASKMIHQFLADVVKTGGMEKTEADKFTQQYSMWCKKRQRQQKGKAKRKKKSRAEETSGPDGKEEAPVTTNVAHTTEDEEDL